MLSRRPIAPQTRGRAASTPSSPLISVNQEVLFDAVPTFDGIISVEQPVVFEATLSYSSYSPESEGGLLGWFKFNDPSAITIAGATLTSYINKISGVSYTPGTAVPYESAGWNGKGCIHPTLVGHAGISNADAALISLFDCPGIGNAKPYTIIAVCSCDSATGSGYVFAVGNSGGTSGTRWWGLRSGVAQYEHGNGAPANNTATVRSTAAATTAQTILCWNSPGVGCTFRVNNGAADPVNLTADPSYTPGTGPNRVSPGCLPRSAPAAPWPGRIGEILIYDWDLGNDATARNRVINDYLTPEWA
jgi:hypothetical protein